MRQLIGYIQSYIRDHLNWKYFFFILFYSGLLLFLNFFYPPTARLRDVWRWSDYGFIYYVVIYFLGLGIPYLALLLFEKKVDLRFLRHPRFLCLIAFAILLWSSRGSLIYYYQIHLAPSLYGPDIKSQFEFRVLFMVIKFFLGLLPIVIYWRIVDRKNQALYGMQRHGLNLKPYLIILALMIPGIVLASQNAGFLAKYPRALLMPAAQLFNPDHRIYIGVYETLYIADFYTLELFFRGFMILAFLKLAGPKAVLPVAVFYVTIHFGKPFGEALSSFFGGTVLGIITFYSRSIWGGIIVHMGIALAMEISAYITHYLRQ